MLVAAVDGQLQAAVPLRGGPAIADPFHRTAQLVTLLELRAAQLRELPASRGGIGTRRYWLAATEQRRKRHERLPPRKRQRPPRRLRQPSAWVVLIAVLFIAGVVVQAVAPKQAGTTAAGLSGVLAGAGPDLKGHRWNAGEPGGQARGATVGR